MNILNFRYFILNEGIAKSDIKNWTSEYMDILTSDYDSIVYDLFTINDSILYIKTEVNTSRFGVLNITVVFYFDDLPMIYIIFRDKNKVLFDHISKGNFYNKYNNIMYDIYTWWNGHGYVNNNRDINYTRLSTYLKMLHNYYDELLNVVKWEKDNNTKHTNKQYLINSINNLTRNLKKMDSKF